MNNHDKERLIKETDEKIKHLRVPSRTSDSDLIFLSKLSRDLQNSGAIERPNEALMGFAEPTESIQDILEEAQKGALYEKDLNPEIYDPELDQQQDDEVFNLWENPNIEY